LSSGVHIPLRPFLAAVPTRSSGDRYAEEISPFAEVVWKIARSARRTIAAITMTVPLSFLLQLLIEGGILRAEAFASLGVAGYIRNVSEVGRAFMDAISSVSLVNGIWDFKLVLLIGLTLVLRYHLMKPLREFERWAKYRIKMPDPQHDQRALKRRISYRQRY